MKKNQKNRRYDRADADALRASNIAASLLGTSGKRYDSVEDASVFFARELDFVKSHAYDKQYPEFTALGLFPVSNEVDPGAESITYYAYDKTGIAKIISNYATDLPRADVKGEPHTAQVKSVVDNYKEGFGMTDVMCQASDAVMRATMKKMLVFGSNNRA